MAKRKHLQGLRRTWGARRAAIALASFRLPENGLTLRCPLCLDFICNAITTACGHTFCEECISEYLLYFKRCLCCPRKLCSSKELGRSKSIDALVDAATATMAPVVAKSLAERKEAHRKQVEARTVREFVVGMDVDVRSPEMVWCEGVVRRILFRGEHGKRLIIVNYKGRPSTLNEEIPDGSERLATAGFYTKNPDLPRLQVSPTGQRSITLLGHPLAYAFVGGGNPESKKCLAESDSSYEFSENE